MSLKRRPYPEYKDSGLPWLGEIPVHWQTERAKWLFKKMDRSVDPAHEIVTCFRDGVVTLRKNRRTEGFTESIQEIGYQGVRRGDLIIHAMDAFAGAVGVSDSDGKCTPVYAVCEPIRDANPRYYARVVREMARTYWITALAKGIRERSTDFRYEAFGNQLLPIPPAEEQKRLEAFSNRTEEVASRLIRAKLRMIELLNEQKQVIIHRAVTRGLDSDVPMKHTGLDWLPEVPEHWALTSVRQIARLLQTGPFGSQLHAHDYVPGGIPVINPSHLKAGRIAPDMSSAVLESTAERLSRHRFAYGDIVLARRGELGRCALVSDHEVGWICGTGCLLLRPREGIFDDDYLLLALSSQGARDFLSLSSVGATMENLNATIVANLRIPCPPRVEQSKIIARISKESAFINGAMDRARREIELIREYRTRLISDVVTGKLDVRGVELPEPEKEGVGAGFVGLESVATEGSPDPEEVQDVALRHQ